MRTDPAPPSGAPVATQDLRTVPLDLVQPETNYVLRVKGNSMADEQIRDGDYLIVNSRKTPERGEMVIAYVAGRAFVRSFHAEAEGRVQLRSSDGSQPAMILPAAEVAIGGIVVGILRKY